MSIYKSTLMLAASVSTLAFLAPAFAAAPGAPVQMAQADTGGVEEIVVTARKRQEASQKVPLAITALSADNLKQQQINSVASLTTAVPGFTVATGGAEIFTGLYSLRGISNLNVGQNQDPGVGIYVDGVYQGFSGSNLNQDDLQRVEVVKGPQGTLFGRNSTGGAIQIIHNLPTNEFEGWVRVGAGNYNEWQTAGMINIPITSKMALRIVGGYNQHDGYGKDPLNGRDINDLKSGNLNATLKVNPTDALQIVVRGFWNDGRSTGTGGFPSAMNIGGLANLEAAAENPVTGASVQNAFFCGIGAPLPCNLATLAADAAALPANLIAAQAAFLAQASASGFSPSFNGITADHAYKTGGSITIDYDFSDNLSLKSITGYIRARRYFTQDFDASSFTFIHSLQDTVEDQLTQEVQFIGTAFSDRLHYQAGVFYYDKAAKDYQSSTDSFPALLIIPTSVFHNRDQAESLSVFGEATYALTSQVNLTGGIRYGTESKYLKQDADNLSSDVHAGDNGKDQFHNLSYRGQIDYTPIQDLMVYLKTSKGYRSGGLQGTGPTTFPPFAQESITDYEAGIKSEFFQNRLRVNAAVYHEDYDNLQQTIFTATSSGALVNAVVNARKAKVDGAEMQLLAVPVRNLTLGFQAAYTYPHYKDFVVNGAKINPVFADVNRYSYTVTADYMIPSVGPGDLRFHADWHWQSKTYYNPLPTGAPQGQNTTFQRPYGIMNARISYTLEKPNLEIGLWGRNLLDQHYITYIADFYDSLGYEAAYSNMEPRVFGFDATYHF